jgi:hypothetical protein
MSIHKNIITIKKMMIPEDSSVRACSCKYEMAVLAVKKLLEDMAMFLIWFADPTRVNISDACSFNKRPSPPVCIHIYRLYIYTYTYIYILCVGECMCTYIWIFLMHHRSINERHLYIHIYIYKHMNRSCIYISLIHINTYKCS